MPSNVPKQKARQKIVPNISPNAYVKLALSVWLLFEVIVITRSIAVKTKLAEPLQLYLKKNKKKATLKRRPRLFPHRLRLSQARQQVSSSLTPYARRKLWRKVKKAFLFDHAQSTLIVCINFSLLLFFNHNSSSPVLLTFDPTRQTRFSTPEAVMRLRTGRRFAIGPARKERLQKK